VIVPDLPGQGQSTCSTALDYQYPVQTERLLDFLTNLGIEQFHLAGNSMGGGIALHVAALVPERVLSIALFNPAGGGVKTPEFAAMVADGKNPLIAEKPEDMFTVTSWAAEEPPFIPNALLKVMGERKAANRAVAEKVWKDIGDALDMEQLLARVQQPAVLIWGDRDKLLAMENVSIFQAGIPHLQTHIMPGIGHVPMVEAPEETARLLKPFWGSVQIPLH
jgi:pimeloyl-ACP methyl ester carboxylesterase